MSDRLALNTVEASALLGISRPTLQAWMREPGFPVVRVGRCVRIPIEPLKAWLADRAEVSRGA